MRKSTLGEGERRSLRGYCAELERRRGGEILNQTKASCNWSSAWFWCSKKEFWLGKRKEKVKGDEYRGAAEVYGEEQAYEWGGPRILSAQHESATQIARGDIWPRAERAIFIGQVADVRIVLDQRPTDVQPSASPPRRPSPERHFRPSVLTWWRQRNTRLGFFIGLIVAGKLKDFMSK